MAPALPLVMQSNAATVEQYLASLPEDRRAALSAVRAVILKNLDNDYIELMQYGMIGYAVPHSVFPAGYHCDPKQPLCYAGLASQKGHMSLYLMCCYGHEPTMAWFQDAWKKSGKKLDMGKACIRFKKLDDVPLEVIGEVFRRTPAKAYIQQYEKLLATQKGRSAAKPAAKPAAKAKASSKPARSKSKTKTNMKPKKKAGTKR